MIGRKTAALIAGSVQAGAMLATDDVAIVGAYRSFGWALGLAFQLNDDLLGIWGEAGDRQGAVGHRRHKKTLPCSRVRAGRAGRDRLRHLPSGVPAPADVDRRRHPRAGGGATREMARRYRDEALAEIRGVEAIDRQRGAARDIIVRVISA
jgi:geranylgeranyl diphosphate synthase type I